MTHGKDKIRGIIKGLKNDRDVEERNYNDLVNCHSRGLGLQTRKN